MGIWGRGVDLSLFSPSNRSMSFRHNKSIEDDEVVILWVGRLVKEKSPDLWAEVIRRLHKDGLRFRALVVGSGSYEENMKKLPCTENLGWLSGKALAGEKQAGRGKGGGSAELWPDVVLLGLLRGGAEGFFIFSPVLYETTGAPEPSFSAPSLPSPDPQPHPFPPAPPTEVYASVDIFLFPSEVETFGNVTLEALASGVPCVASAGCSGHLVYHGVNGFVVHSADADEYYELTKR